MNIVEYAYKMKDMASGPLGKIAGAFSKTDEAAQKAQKSASLFSKLSAGAFGVLNIVRAVQGAIGAVKQFTEANQAQQEAEAKLAHQSIGIAVRWKFSGGKSNDFNVIKNGSQYYDEIVAPK